MATGLQHEPDSSLANKSKPRPLCPHATPRNDAQLGCVPLGYRQKSAGFRPNMDRMVENDTRDFHWHLSKSETRGFLRDIYPDTLLFDTSSPTQPNSMSQILLGLRDQNLFRMTTVEEEYWAGFPDNLKGENPEENMAKFLNNVLEAVEKITRETTGRRWHAKGAKKVFAGSLLQRKPDLVLSLDSADSDWRDVLVFGEMKCANNNDNLKASFTEMAGKTGVLLYAQDGRHAAPALRILGSTIGLTYFDRGGSLETECVDIHEDPEIFLRILLGLSKANFSQLGFDVSLLDDEGNKRVLVVWEGEAEAKEVTLDKLLFISDIMHGRGTTVWRGVVKDAKWPRTRRGVVIKDCWIDPLRKYTEGRILSMLNHAGVVGVPKLIHEEQVPGPHPTRPDALFNNSTHLLRSLFSEANRRALRRQYQLRVLSRLVTTPVGSEILKFNSLAELLVAFIDYVLTHKEAVERAGILHRDISLFNLLIVLSEESEERSKYEERLSFLDSLPDQTRQRLRQKILECVDHRGLLADWGYSVPIGSDDSKPNTRPATPDQGSDSIKASIDSKTGCGEGAVPALLRDGRQQPDSVQYVPAPQLRCDHDIKLPMAREYLDSTQPSIDTNPLCRTGTWSWMAVELVLAGPGKPVVHRPTHDLESMFYVLVGICMLLDQPHHVKTEDNLSCFDTYFNSFQPSTAKTTTIQSNIGWSCNILPHISPYFRPLIPLLKQLREKIIVPMDFTDDQFTAPKITHDLMLDALLDALCNLEDKSWVKILPPKDDGSIPSAPLPASSTSRKLDSGSAGPEKPTPRQSERLPVRIPRAPPIRAISGSGFAPAKLASSSGSGSPNQRPASNTESTSNQPQSTKRPRPSLSSPPPPRTRSRYSSTAPPSANPTK